MFHYNKVLLSGTLTRDPEVKFTPKGTAIANSSLAINRVWKDEQGNKKEEVTFVEFTAFGRTAEVLGEWCKKGHTIFIEGRLKLDAWDDKETGKKRSKLSVICEQMSFVDKPKGEKSQSESSAKSHGRPHAPADPDLDGAPKEDGMPF